MNSLMSHEPQVPVIKWSRLECVYTIGNGKGGVGKSNTTAHIGALVASDGARVLIVDLNRQGNIAHLLGFANTSNDDQGKNLFSAITAGALLTPATNVRPNLDVVPGGDFVRKINGALSAEMGTQQDAARAYLTLAEAICAIADQYDLILIDSPPENQLLLHLALCASRFVLVPMRPDGLSRLGLRGIAADIRDMREHNPHLMLLAVFVFASGTGSKKIRRELAENVAHDLGASSDVLLKGFIRHAESVADQVVKYGLLAHELEQEIQNNPRHWEIRKGTAKSATIVSETSRLVAEDYAKLAAEVLTRAATRRTEMIKEGVWP